MKNSRQRLMFAAAILVASILPGQSSETPSLVGTLELDSERILPGLPVGIRFTLSNVSTKDVAVPSAFALEIETPEGDTRIVPWGASEHYVSGFPAVYRDALLLKKGESKTYQLPVNALLSSPSAFMGRAFFAPGTYRVRAALSDQLMTEEYEGVLRRASRFSAMSSVPHDMVITNAVLLRVEEPQGDDLAAWNEIKRRTANEGLLDLSLPELYRLAGEIWDRYPSSGYAPYMGMKTAPASDQQRIATIARVRQMDPKNPLLDWVPLGDAYRLARAAGDAMDSERDLSKAIELSRQAGEAFREVIRTTDNDVVRLEAEQSMDKEIMTPGELIRLDRKLAEVDPRPPMDAKKIQPLAECVHRVGSDLTVRLGYENPNPYNVTIPIGPRNGFDPSPGDRGQPTVFKSGVHRNVLEISVRGDSVSWRLDGATITAALGNTADCNAGTSH